MPVRIVQSKQNARLKELRRALSKPPRTGGELAGIEGPNLLEEALRTKLRVKCVFLRLGEEGIFASGPDPSIFDTLMIPAEIFDSIVQTETPQPVAALIETPQWTWEDVLAARSRTAPLILVLAGLQDPGNLGTILRSAEAFGATGVVSLPGTVSAWNPKAVRASAGSIFRVPFISTNSDDCAAHLRESGVKLWTTAVHNAESSPNVDLQQPVAILIGNEGNGVPDEIAALASDALTIPCPGPVESLNAAVAASVLLYEAAQQRSNICAGKGRAR